MRLAAPEARREGERDALCDDDAAARVEVRPHPLGVDLETGDGVSGGRCRSAGECERAGERLPLGVPAAYGALVLVSELAEQDSGVRVGQARTRHREGRADGIALLRHRRGSSARRLSDLAHLALREEHDVATDLCGRSRRSVQCRAELCDALAVRVPREHGLPEPELLCVEPGDLECLVPESGERPCSATELGCEPLVSHGDESPARLENRDEPACRLEPERRRHRLLEEGARSHRRRAVGTGERGTSVGEPVELREHECDGAARDEHRGGVDDVLAGRTQMDVVGSLVADGRAELADERLRRVPDPAAVGGETGGVVELGAARISDASGCVLRDDAECGASLREGAFRIEHPLQPRAIRHRLSQLLRHEDGRERCHTAKNVV